MATNKSFTSLEQSKKLAEILPVPKFKVGDWLVHKDMVGVLCCITQIHAPHYYLTNNNSFIKFGEEDNYRPWTIQDAKDGDVLVCESGERTLECLFIFKLIADREVYEYCSYRTFDKHFSLKYSFLGYVDNVYHPATQEQCSKLFSKIAEEGYKWDAEKLELKKVEQKPTWNLKDLLVVTK